MFKELQGCAIISISRKNLLTKHLIYLCQLTTADIIRSLCDSLDYSLAVDVIKYYTFFIFDRQYRALHKNSISITELYACSDMSSKQLWHGGMRLNACSVLGPGPKSSPVYFLLSSLNLHIRITEPFLFPGLLLC